MLLILIQILQVSYHEVVIYNQYFRKLIFLAMITFYKINSRFNDQIRYCCTTLGGVAL